jgi:hypothetical protein
MFLVFVLIDIQVKNRRPFEFVTVAAADSRVFHIQKIFAAPSFDLDPAAKA